MEIFSHYQTMHYEQEGFVVAERFLTNGLLDRVEKIVAKLTQSECKTIPREHLFYEDREVENSLKQIQHLDQHSTDLFELFHHGIFKHAAEELLQQPALGINLQYFNKPPGSSRPTPPHQDGFYFKLSPPHALTMWLALDSVDKGNGCVRYLPGSHREGLRQHMTTETLGFSQGIPNYPTAEERENEVAISAEPGDLLIHHALTVHRAETNKSNKRNRRALGFIYYGADAQIDEHAVTHYQSELQARLHAEGRI